MKVERTVDGIDAELGARDRAASVLGSVIASVLLVSVALGFAFSVWSAELSSSGAYEQQRAGDRVVQRLAGCWRHEQTDDCLQVRPTLLDGQPTANQLYDFRRRAAEGETAIQPLPPKPFPTLEPHLAASTHDSVVALRRVRHERDWTADREGLPPAAQLHGFTTPLPESSGNAEIDDALVRAYIEADRHQADIELLWRSAASWEAQRRYPKWKVNRQAVGFEPPRTLWLLGAVLFITLALVWGLAWWRLRPVRIVIGTHHVVIDGRRTALVDIDGAHQYGGMLILDLRDGQTTASRPVEDDIVLARIVAEVDRLLAHPDEHVEERAAESEVKAAHHKLRERA